MTSVYLLDVNVLIALTHASHIGHTSALTWFRGLGDSRFATTPITEAGFVRLSLNPSVVGRALGADEVLATMGALRAHTRHHFIEDASSLAEPTISTGTLVGHNHVTDYHLVNLAAINGAVFATLDRKLVGTMAPADRKHVHVIT